MSRFDISPRDRSASTRRRRLKLYPFCGVCARSGIQRLTKIIDHIVPLAFGGPDTDENCQGLCALHDAIKTASEQPSQQAASNHPDWLRHSSVPVTIVVGPPCGGKSTFCDGFSNGELVIDLDLIAFSLQPDWDRRWNSDLLNRSIRIRNALLGSLADLRSGAALFCITAPTLEERTWWFNMLGPLVMLEVCDPGIDVARARAMKRDGRDDHVCAWYASRLLPWSRNARPHLVKAAFDVDGYPVEF